MILQRKVAASLRRLSLLFGFALLVAACSSGGGDATTTSPPGGPVPPAPSSTSSTTTSTTVVDPSSAPADLVLAEVVPTDPDPLETIEPLTGVSVSSNSDGSYVFTFGESQYGGLGVRLTGLPESDLATCDWFSAEDFDGAGEGTGCFYQTADGFEVTEPVSNGDAPPSSVVMMLVVTMDSVTLTIGDMTFTGTGLRFDDGPLFVQIDPNTGGLAEPVTRRTGEITAADLYAAING